MTQRSETLGLEIIWIDFDDILIFGRNIQKVLE